MINIIPWTLLQAPTVTPPETTSFNLVTKAVLDTLGTQVDSLLTLAKQQKTISPELIAIIASFALLVAIMYLINRRLHRLKDLEESVDIVLSRTITPSSDKRVTETQACQARLDQLDKKLDALPDLNALQTLEKEIKDLQPQLLQAIKEMQPSSVDLGPVLRKLHELATLVETKSQELAEAKRESKPAAPISSPLPEPAKSASQMPAQTTLEQARAELLKQFKAWNSSDLRYRENFLREQKCDAGTLIGIAPMLNSEPFATDTQLKYKYSKDDYFHVQTRPNNYGFGNVQSVESPALVLIDLSDLPKVIQKGNYMKITRFNQ